MSEIRYYYKPPKTYPARIYALWGKDWQPRNMMPMGISRQPLLTRRSMTKYELERAATCHRMIYYQFESLAELIAYEREELADEGKPTPEIEQWIDEIRAVFSKYFPA